MAMLRFIKAHGLGNDFIILDAFREEAALAQDLSSLARTLCDRRRGVGADQLLTLEPPSADADATIRMRVFNADGGEAEMCGNGIRCVVRLAVDRGHAPGPRVAVQTLAGTRHCERLGGDLVRVGMGRPEFDPAACGLSPRPGIPVEQRGGTTALNFDGVVGVVVTVGTPHVVSFSDQPVSIAFASHHGARIETHPAFPKRVNVQFATRVAPDRVSVRTWERGAGLTEACGTGACAVFAAGRALGLLSEAASLALPGGELRIEEGPGGEILKTGPATIVFEGVWAG